GMPSDDHVRSGLRIDLADGQALGVVQIGGLVARRFLWFVQTGHQLEAGQRFGLIRFGSRVDVYLPAGARVLVAEGQTAVAGETVLADLTSAAPVRGIRRD